MKLDTSWEDLTARIVGFIGRGESDALEFNRLALELFGKQFEGVEIYRELCLSRGIKPGGVSKWEEIPALPTEAFKEFEATSIPVEERTAVFYSSGTTAQERSRHFHSAATLAVYEASLLPWFRRRLWTEDAPMTLLVLTPSREAAPHSSLAYMFDTVARGFPWRAVAVTGRVAADGAWEMDLDRSFEVLCETEGPVAILGTAYAFVRLLDGRPDERLKLAPGSRVLETGGYKGRSRALTKAALRQLIGRRLGIGERRIVSEYGMSELGSQAYDRVAGEEGGVFHFPPWARAEVVSPETGRAVAEGETGLLRVFDLANIGSVIAVQTGDLATRRGAGFELLGRAVEAEARGCSLMTV